MIFDMHNYVIHLCFKVQFVSPLLPYALYSVNALKWKTTFFVCNLYLWICIIIFYLVSSACVPGTYICAYVSVYACVLPTYMCTHIHELCMCICLMLSHAGAVYVCARVCVLPSEMECVLFYSRKIAHRANAICCIMYLTLNKFYLILSSLIYILHNPCISVTFKSI